MIPYTRKHKRTLTGSVRFVVLVLSWTGTALAQDWQIINDSRNIMEEGYIQVVGGSEERQSRYRALRAATVVAQRELLEAFQGLTIAGGTTVKDGMLDHDIINSEVKGFLRGAVKCGEKYHSDKGYAEVCMRLYIRGKGGGLRCHSPASLQRGGGGESGP